MGVSERRYAVLGLTHALQNVEVSGKLSRRVSMSVTTGHTVASRLEWMGDGEVLNNEPFGVPLSFSTHSSPPAMSISVLSHSHDVRIQNLNMNAENLTFSSQMAASSKAFDRKPLVHPPVRSVP